MHADALKRGLIDGSLDDDGFDALLPKRWRFASEVYWSPVEVAVHAARWFEASGARRVLDVGSGPGKFCVVAALCTALEMSGIEERRKLYDVALELAELLGVSARARFHWGRIDDAQLAGFDGYYLYNPFGENLHAEQNRLDTRVELGPSRYEADVACVERCLEAASVGARLAVYHGFVGKVPDSWELVSADPIGTDRLCIWQKQRAHSSGGYWIEEEEPSGSRVPMLIKGP